MSIDIDCISLVMKKVGRWTNALCKHVSRSWYSAASNDKYNRMKELQPNMMVFAVSTNSLNLVRFVHKERVLQVASGQARWIPNNDWLWTETTSLSTRQRPSANKSSFRGNPDIFQFLIKSGYTITLDEVVMVIRDDNVTLLKIYLSSTDKSFTEGTRWLAIEMIDACAMKCLEYCIVEHPDIFEEYHLVSAIRQDKVEIVRALKGILNWPTNPCRIASEYGSSKCLSYMLQMGTPFDYHDCLNATDNVQCKLLFLS